MLNTRGTHFSLFDKVTLHFPSLAFTLSQIHFTEKVDEDRGTVFACVISKLRNWIFSQNLIFVVGFWELIFGCSVSIDFNRDIVGRGSISFSKNRD